MLKNLGLIFASLVFFFFCLFAYAKFEPSLSLSIINNNRTDFFTVSAEGKVTAVPDVAQVTLGFSTTGANISQIQNEANLVIKNITTSVKNLGVGEWDIKTTNYNLHQDYEKKNNFVIDVNLTVKVKDFAKLNQIIDAGTQNGANQIGNLYFTFDDPEKFQSQARNKINYFP